MTKLPFSTTAVRAFVGAACCLGVALTMVPCNAQELIGPGDAMSESQELPAPSLLGKATSNPFAQSDSLMAAGSDDDSDLLLDDPLKNYRKTLEEHLLKKERAKLEARARFESRSRDLIPAPLPPKRLPSPTSTDVYGSDQPDAELDRLRAKLDSLDLAPGLSLDSEEVPSPSDRPKQTKQPSTTDSDLDDLLAPPLPKANPSKPKSSTPKLPPPLRERSNTARPQPLGQPERLKPTPPATKRDATPQNRNPIPKYRATPAPRNNQTSRNQPATSKPETKRPETKPTETQSDSSAWANSRDGSTKDDAQPSPIRPQETRSVLQSSPAEATNSWESLVDAERYRWSTPASFRHNAPVSQVTCSTCGGCVDRHGVGACDRTGVYLGVGTREKPDCQCWRCPQQAPFNLYGPGGYAGPARSTPVADYRLRAGDQLQLTFMIKTVRTIGAYRLVVGDELLIESDADENLTRGSLDRGLEIQPDGTITLRFIGQVHAAGQTIEQLRELLNDRYEEYYPDPAIDVTPVQTGSVARHIREAISGSEGFNPQQTLQTVTPEGSIRLPRLGAIPTQGLTLGELKREINLRYESLGAGLEVEVVLEEQAPHFIYVLGEVAQPGQFEITNPTTALGGLSLAGSYIPGANLRQIVIFRRGPNWELVSTVLDLRGALLGKASRPTDEIWLQDGDVIIVPPAPIQLFDRFVQQVFTDGIYGIVPFSGFGFSLGNNN
ncbi:polysaccharide biosynthesis/export family protein [Neorhodopirellula lusitana]|uniref:polysaccharide biosynthesis/export family protein n=1 Tax=Neorhodopirellula lusitana TaxID=445327 RepID=UPI003850D499